MQMNILYWNWTPTFVQTWSSSLALLTPQPSLFSAEVAHLQKTRRNQSDRALLWLSIVTCREKEWLPTLGDLNERTVEKEGLERRGNV